MRSARLTAVFVLLASALALHGCWVHALEPLASDDKVYFERALLGKWSLPDKNGESKVALSILRDVGNRYDVIVHMPGERDGKAQDLTLKAFAVRLGEHTFLEFSPSGALQPAIELAGPFLLPTYHASRFVVEGDTLSFFSPSPDWFETQAKAGTLDLPHVLVRGGVLLTAKTAELQAWCEKHALDEKIYAPTLALTRATPPVPATPGPSAPAQPEPKP